jgi:hypothetical protein
LDGECRVCQSIIGRCIPAKILVIPPTLCVAEAVQWLGRIIDSLFPLMMFLNNHQCALPLDQGIVFTQQHNMMGKTEKRPATSSVLIYGQTT